MTTTVLRCDFCGKDMGDDETGMFCLADEKGGHIMCYVRHIVTHEPLNEGNEE